MVNKMGKIIDLDKMTWNDYDSSKQETLRLREHANLIRLNKPHLYKGKRYC